MGARFYWPEIGRFIQQDPIGDDINWYTYAANNPLVFIDPEGLVSLRSIWARLRASRGSPPASPCGGQGYVGVGGSLPVWPYPGIAGVGVMGGLIYGPDPNADPTVAPWDRRWLGGAVHWADVNLHPYLGPGFGTVGGSVNYAPAPQSPGTGWSLQGSGYLPVLPLPVPMGPGGTYGYDFASGTTFKEFGWGTPGAWSGFVHPLW